MQRITCTSCMFLICSLVTHGSIFLLKDQIVDIDSEYRKARHLNWYYFALMSELFFYTSL